MKKNYGPILITGVILLSLVTAAQATPYTGADIEKNGVDYFNIDSIDQPGVSDWSSLVDGSIYTNWANQWVEYQADLTAGIWNIGVNVINHGNLGTGWYSIFEILNNQTNTKLIIPASDTEVNSGFITETIAAAGSYTIRYTWTNDQYDPSNGRDANVQIINAFFDNVATEPVPEPATMLLFGTGLIGLAGVVIRKKK